MGIVIRKAERRDTESINSLFSEMLRSVYGKVDDAGYEEGYLDRYFRDAGDMILLAEESGLPVGFLSLQVHSEPQEYVYLDDFAVTEPYRSRGIGAAMLGLAEEYALQRSIHSIALHVEKSNCRAERLYLKRGYRRFRDDGNRFLMVKDLIS